MTNPTRRTRRPASATLLCLLGAILAAAALAPAPAAAHQAIDSGDIPPGGNFTWTFFTPRGFTYHCHPHPWMTGSVVVLAPEADRDPVEHAVRIVEPESDSDSWAFEPSSLQVQVGDRVTWVNEGAVVHTVSEEDDHGGGHDHGDHSDHGGAQAEAPAAAAALLGLAAALLVAFAARARPKQR